MGILARRQGAVFVIASDRLSHAEPTKKAPRFSEVCQVWTGIQWSTSMDQAMSFSSIDEAEEYIRANSSRVTT